MRKGIIVIVGLFLIAPQVFAGGMERVISSKEIGTPPEALIRGKNITRDRGKAELFYPALDFFSRVLSHHIAPGDKKPGPGWGVPEGHNIGNAPTPRVIGKQLDRTERGKLEIVTDFMERLERHEKEKRK